MVRKVESSEESASAAEDPGDSPGTSSEERKDPGASPGLLRSLEALVTEVTGAVSTLIEVRADRARLATRRAIARAVVLMFVVLAVAAWIVVGTVYLLRGLSGAVTALSGGAPWVGEATIGLVALGAVALGLRAYLRGSEAREVRRLEEKYGVDSEPRSSGREAASGETAGGDPGPGGATRTPARGEGAPRSE